MDFLGKILFGRERSTTSLQSMTMKSDAAINEDKDVLSALGVAYHLQLTITTNLANCCLPLLSPSATYMMEKQHYK